MKLVKYALIAFAVLLLIDIIRMDNVWELFPYWYPFAIPFLIVYGIPISLVAFFIWRNIRNNK